MCENILAETLNNKIPLNVLLDWLGGANTKELNFKEVTKWNCDRVAFISFFLNHIHDTTLRCDSNESPEQQPHTLTPSRTVLFETNSNFVSPLYKPKKSPSPKTPPTICLGDFITRKDTKKRVQRNLNENAFGNCVRRINPTNVSQRHGASLNKNKNSFSFEERGEEVLADFIERRNLLAEECVKVMARRDDTVTDLPVFRNVKKGVVPHAGSVTFRDQLKVLGVIYTFLLDNCLVVNVTSEMYFVFTMLLSKSGGAGSSVLDSVHNRVFFAVFVLGRQRRFLEVLDKFTVRLLLENGRFEEFADNKLLVEVKHLLESKTETCAGGAHDEQASVYFVCDTDNRSNFPSDSSFRNFRKQRDLFYEILQMWESQHVMQEWSFDKVLGSKIRALINMHSEPCNFVHFAKLFKAQLITSLCSSPGDAQPTVVRSLPNVDAEKLSRLNTRMTGKQSSSGINSMPTFTGLEEFFKHFILIANSYLFNRHLIDALVAEIIHLNHFSLNSEEFNVDNVLIKKLYVDRLKSLQIVAKFLGFLEALPYKSECNRLSQDIIKCQLQIRNRVQSSLNLIQIVSEAVCKKILTLTVPWLTKYLAMLDPISFKLDHLKEVTRMLFQIYYSSDLLVVKLSLGWLFDLPHFPNELYYQWVSQGALCALPKPDTIDFYLDESDFVDPNVSYLCCPYLDEIKQILLSDANETNRAVTFKHITPVSTVESPSDVTNRRMQKQLEEAFFRSQPDSVRKTVEFVSERVASGYVKEICYDLVPAHKQSSLVKLRTELSRAEDAQAFANVCFENLKNSIEVNMQVVVAARVASAMDALLATVVLKETRELCVAVAKRNCLNRVQEWVQTHIQEEIFSNHFSNELRKPELEPNSTKSKAVFTLPLFGKSHEHNVATRSGVELMNELKEHSRNILVRSESVTFAVVKQLLESIGRSLDERCDINDCILLGINRMVLDFLMTIVALKPEFVTEGLCADSCALFRRSSAIDDLFGTLISPRNQFMMAMSRDEEASCIGFVTLVDSLIENELLSEEGFREQAEGYCAERRSGRLSETLRLRVADC